MKKLLIFLLLVTSITVTSQNFAYIERDSILNSQPAYKINLTAIDSLKQVYVKQVQEERNNWNSAITAVLSTYNVQENENIDTVKERMNDVDKSKLELLLDEEKLLTKKAKNFDLQLQTKYNETVQPIINKINSTIENYAKKEKIDVVYTIEELSPALAYINKSKNITTAIIKLL